ncbi:MAG: leucyl aminopeptidase, partial [Pseudomonadota bacterium]
MARGTPAFGQLDHGGWLSRAAALAKGTVTLSAPPPPLERVVVVDLPETRDPRSSRRLGGAIAAELAKLSGGAVSVAVDGVDAAELAHGLRLRSYRPLRKYRTRPDDEESPGVDEVVIAAADPVSAEVLHRRLDHVAQGVFLARDLTAEPGNALGPAEFAHRAGLLAAHGVDVQLIDPEAEGLGLLSAVGRGSARPPLLAVLRWHGGGEEKPLVLVGKGITFDAGGISIKPAEHMEEMKGDMAGAAAVLGAMRAVAGRGARTNVVGVLALAENMPSGRALRPGDVVR